MKKQIKNLIVIGATLSMIAITSNIALSQNGILSDATGVSIGVTQPIQVIYVKKGVPYEGPIIYSNYKAEAGVVLVGAAGCECFTKIDSIGEVLDISGLIQQKIYLSDVLVTLKAN